MLPLLHQSISLLWEAGTASPELCQKLVEACISASAFSNVNSKRSFLQVAENIQATLLRGKPDARVKARRMALSSLYPNEIDPPPESITELMPLFDRQSNRSNAHYGQIVLMLAQRMIHDFVEPSLVCTTIRQFHPRNKGSPSYQEEQVMTEGQFVIAKSYMIWGQFDISEQYFHSILKTAQSLGFRIIKRVIPHHCQVLCERGRVEEAIAILRTELTDSTLAKSTKDKLTLTMANALLMKSLHTADNIALKEADILFETLLHRLPAWPSTLGKANLFAIKAGQAMTYYQHGLCLHTALEKWEAARQAASDAWPEPGYSQMMALYAQSEIAFRLGLEDAQALLDRAVSLFRRVGRRQYYFLGHGSSWLDAIGAREEGGGRVRMVRALQQPGR